MELLKTYACYTKNEHDRFNSSSGGIFTVIAEYVLSKNGVVYGVTMSEDCYSAQFIAIEKHEDLYKLRGAKYLQAEIGDTYSLVKKNLKDGKLVFFTGTGCQVNGLKKFLGQKYEKLICVDILCHGVPSQIVWEKYLLHQEHKYREKIKHVNFRCKDRGWYYSGMKENQVFIYKDDDSFMRLFLRNYCLRPSCYNCIAKQNKLSDLSIADFWGIHEIAPDMDDGKGCSLVIVRTTLGEKIFSVLKEKLYIKEVTYDEGVKYNPMEYKSVDKPLQRKEFFEDVYEMNYKKLIKKYARIPMKRKIKNKIKMILVEAKVLKNH